MGLALALGAMRLVNIAQGKIEDHPQLYVI
jgi:hypothetical protein